MKLPTWLLLSQLSLVVACSDSDSLRPDGATDAGGGSGGHSGEGAQAGSSERGGSGNAGGQADAGEGGAGATDGGEAGSGSCTFRVTSSVSPAIATVGIVEWSTDFPDLETAQVEFGLDDSYAMVAPVDLEEAGYRTLLLGMKPSRDYHFRIVAEGPTGSCASEDFTLTTGPLPSGLSNLTVTDHEQKGTAGGFLISGFLLDGPAFILDADGDYVWWYGSGEMGRAAMSHDGGHMWFAGINVSGGNAAMRRVTMDGLVEDDFSTEFEDIHHDFTVLPDETVAFISHTGERDLVIERAPDGTLTTIFDVADAHGGITNNHANSIHYWPDDDTYTVSDLSQDAYVKVTRSGEVVWVLGGSTSDFTGDGATWKAQHGHHVLSEDRLLFFSNGPFEGPSEAIEVTLDFRTMTATRAWRYVSGERSLIFGDVGRLTNGNTLVTYSSFGRIHEVSPDGELVQELEWASPGAVGYVTKRASLYGPPNR